MGPVTSVTKDMPRASIKLAEMISAKSEVTQGMPAFFSPQSDALFGVQGIFDFTGSTGANHPVIDRLEKSLKGAFGEDGGRIWYASVCMTSGAHTTGYMPLPEFEPPVITPFGYSPHGATITKAIENDLGLIAQAKAMGKRVAAIIHVIQADGGSSDDYTGPLQAYRKHQRDNKVACFPILLPPTVPGFVESLSVDKEPTPCTADALAALFDQLKLLVKLALKDPSVIGRTRSLTTMAMPKAI